MPDADKPVPSAHVTQAAMLALSAAATRARHLAAEEEAEVHKLLEQAVNAQAELIGLRLKAFPQMAQALSDERSSLQVVRSHDGQDREVKGCLCLLQPDTKSGL